MYDGVTGANPALRSAPGSSGLYEVLDLILDKGIVIDAYVRVSLVGIELLTVDARIVIASVDTYLRWAEAADRLVLNSEPKTLSDLMSGGGSIGVANSAGKAAGAGKEIGKKKSKRFISRLTGNEEDEEQEQEDGNGRSASRSRSRSRRK